MNRGIEPLPGQFFRVEELNSMGGKELIRVRLMAYGEGDVVHQVRSRIVDEAPRSWNEYEGMKNYTGSLVKRENVTPELLSETIAILQHQYVESIKYIPVENLLGDYPPKRMDFL